RVLSTHPFVAEACVVGVPDDQWGQSVTAAIVPTDATTPAESTRQSPIDDLAELVRATIGRAAVPKRFVVLPALPAKGPGKVDRVAVRELLASREPASPNREPTPPGGEPAPPGHSAVR
ncbi:MAG: hypothetical protein J2O49_10190, partial [Sciscionella sp.]|nr:hypothetical protein [Sciscionella sp.]